MQLENQLLVAGVGDGEDSEVCQSPDVLMKMNDRSDRCYQVTECWERVQWLANKKRAGFCYRSYSWLPVMMLRDFQKFCQDQIALQPNYIENAFVNESPSSGISKPKKAGWNHYEFAIDIAESYIQIISNRCDRRLRKCARRA